MNVLLHAQLPSIPSRLFRLFATTVLLWPAVVVLALYSEWLLAWFAMGHPPRPSLDDPSDIPYSRWLQWPVGVGFALSPLVALVGLPIVWIHLAIARASVVRRWTLVSLFAASWVLAFTLLRWDPGAVVYWWMD